MESVGHVMTRMVYRIENECSKLAQKEYKTRNNQNARRETKLGILEADNWRKK